jgi:hypothetical protein
MRWRQRNDDVLLRVDKKGGVRPEHQATRVIDAIRLELRVACALTRSQDIVVTLKHNYTNHAQEEGCHYRNYTPS